jgi:fibronectin type 3 domain-containing protein
MDSRKVISWAGILLLATIVTVPIVLRPNATPGSPTKNAPPPVPPPLPVKPTAAVAPTDTSTSSAARARKSSGLRGPVFPPSSQDGSIIQITHNRDEILEDNGALAYKGREYIMTADRSGLHSELRAGSPYENRPRISLHLDEVRVGKSQLPLKMDIPPAKDAEKSLSFDHGAVIERVTCDHKEFEQDFVISELPADRGAITVSERISTGLATPAEGTSGAALVFGDQAGGAFQISKAVAVDAQGRTLPLDLRYSAGRIEMTVPESWVRDAVLPVVIDPLVGSAFSIVTNLQGSDGMAALAYGSGPNEWLAAWWDQPSSATHVYAQRISATGVLQGSATQVNTTGGVSGAAVAYSPATNSYLVVYEAVVNGLSKTYYLIARFVTAAGAVPNGEIILASSTSFGFRNPSVATDGVSTFYVVCETVTGGGSAQLTGYLLNNAGSILASASPQPSTSAVAQYPRVAYSSPEYLVSWEEGANVQVRGMNTSGTFLTPITTAATGGTTPPPPGSLSAGGGKFLVTWTTGTFGTAVLGRVITAGSGSSVTFATSAFTVSSGSIDNYPDASYSATVGQWFVAHQFTNSVISSNLVSASGASGAEQTVTTGAAYPKTAWNSATNDVLVAYEYNTSVTNIYAVRYNLGQTTNTAVTDLYATAATSIINLSWSAVTGATSYKVFRSQTSGSYPPTPLTTVTTPGYLDPTVSNGSTYFYVVVASSGSAADSPKSNEVTATPIAAPTGLTATPGNSQVTLAWTPVAGATGYAVYRSTTSGGPFTDILGYPSSTSFNDTAVVNGTTYYFVVAALDVVGASTNSGQVSVTPSAPASISALLVVGNTSLGAGDAAIRTRLQNQGYTVVVKGDSASVTSDATGMAMVVISSTVTSGNVGTKFTNVSVPLLNWEPSLMNPLGMTGSTSGTNFGTITGQTQVAMVPGNAAHPMAAGLTGTMAVLASANTFTFGQPNANATVIATLANDSSKSAIWVYESGVVMPGLTAPARRVGFFLNDTTAANLNANGATLFDAAVRYCAGAPSFPAVVNAQATSSGVSLTWEAASGAISYRVYRSTSPPTAGNWGTLLAPGVTLPTYVDASAVVGQTYYYTVIAMNASGFGVAVTASVTQAKANTVVAALGWGYIRRLPPPPADPYYCTGDYLAIVKYTDANGVSTIFKGLDIDPNFPNMWGWAPNGNPNSIGGIAYTGMSMTLSATQNTGDGNILAQFNPNQTRYPGGPVGKQTFTVKSRRVTTVKVLVRFPSNNPGKTTWTYTNSKGVVEDPFDLDKDTGQLTSAALDARNGIAIRIKGYLRKYWGQALVDFYVNPDPTLPTDPTMTLEGFNAGTFADEKKDGTASDEFLALQNNANLHKKGWINLWLVHAIASGDTGTALKGQTTAMITDAIDDITTSHEMGHCFGLDDAEKLAAVEGTLNNTTPVEGDAAARLRLLMLHSGNRLKYANGGWLTTVELNTVRDTVTNQNYEAFDGSEPPP